MRKILLFLAAVAIAGCSAATNTPRGQCYSAMGVWSIGQTGIEAAVKLPSLKPADKLVLKQVSEQGTLASEKCVEAARTNPDEVGFYTSIMIEGARMARELIVRQGEVPPSE